MNKLYILIALGLILLACEKTALEKEPESLSEIIYGTWELREIISLVTFEDLDYHEAPRKPFLRYEFREDGTYLILYSRGAQYEIDTESTFELIEQDSSLHLGTSIRRIKGYSNDTLDLRGVGRHGEFGEKLFKID